MPAKPISERTWNGDQSWHHEVIERAGVMRVRFHVRVNAYKAQSYGRAQVWSGDEWRDVHEIPGEQLQTEVSYVQRGVTAAAFSADMAELRRVTLAVLDIKPPK